MTEEMWGRDYNAWIKTQTVDFVPAPENSLMLATDDWGDTVYVLTPAGRVVVYTSDGNVIDDDPAGILSFLHDGLTSGILGLCGRY